MDEVIFKIDTPEFPTLDFPDVIFTYRKVEVTLTLTDDTQGITPVCGFNEMKSEYRHLLTVSAYSMPKFLKQCLSTVDFRFTHPYWGRISFDPEYKTRKVRTWKTILRCMLDGYESRKWEETPKEYLDRVIDECCKSIDEAYEKAYSKLLEFEQMRSQT